MGEEEFFSKEVLRHIAKKIATYQSNSEIEELFTDAGFKEQIADTNRMSKTERVYTVLSYMNSSWLLGKESINKILTRFIDPIRFEGKEYDRLEAINSLNTALLRMKIQITEDGKIVKTENLVKYDNKSTKDSTLDDLLAKCNSKGLILDDNWVTAISALNVIEAAINKKLDDLDGSTEGSYTERLNRVADLIKKKENRTISKMIPETLYKGPRQKLDHASHKNAPTKKESEIITKSVIDFMDELFS